MHAVVVVEDGRAVPLPDVVPDLCWVGADGGGEPLGVVV